VDRVDVFFVPFRWCGPCGECLCLIVWGVCVAGVAMGEVVCWSAVAWGEKEAIKFLGLCGVRGVLK
jgi:hypothetical protein